MLTCLVTPSFASTGSLGGEYRVFPGIERFSEGLARGILHSGSDARIVTIRRKGEVKSEQLKGGPEILRLEESSFHLGRVGSIAGLDQLTFSFRVLQHPEIFLGADVVLFNMAFPALGLITRQFPDVRTAVILHHREPWTSLAKLAVVPFVETYLRLGVPDYFVAPSKSSAAEYCRMLRIPISRIRVVPWGVDSTLFTPGPRTERRRDNAVSKVNLLYVGTAEKRKNLETLLSAVRTLNRSGIHARLMVIGPGHQRTVEHARALGVADSVELRGVVSDKELVHQYQQADIYVSASKLEGFGLSLLEAMACGTPVVACAHSSLPEVIGNGGIVIPSCTPLGIAEAVKSLVGNPELYEDISQKARLRASGMSWEQAARSILS